MGLGEAFSYGFLYLMADGSVHCISWDIDEVNMRALITWNGRENKEPWP
jgi:hypothetical protein